MESWNMTGRLSSKSKHSACAMQHWTHTQGYTKPHILLNTHTHTPARAGAQTHKLHKPQLQAAQNQGSVRSAAGAPSHQNTLYGIPCRKAPNVVMQMSVFGRRHLMRSLQHLEPMRGHRSGVVVHSHTTSPQHTHACTRGTTLHQNLHLCSLLLPLALQCSHTTSGIPPFLGEILDLPLQSSLHHVSLTQLLLICTACGL